MSTERDTHFAGFAKIVWNEIGPMVNDSGLSENAKQLIAERIQRILAQRAYDLLVHDRLNSGTIDLQSAGSYLEAAEMVNGIPDLTAWPKDD